MQFSPITVPFERSFPQTVLSIVGGAIDWYGELMLESIENKSWNTYIRDLLFLRSTMACILDHKVEFIIKC